MPTLSVTTNQMINSGIAIKFINSCVNSSIQKNSDMDSRSIASVTIQQAKTWKVNASHFG